MTTKEKIVAAKERLLESFKNKTTELPSHSTDSRLPNGQRWTSGFPVLDLGIKPEMDLASWQLEIITENKISAKYTLKQLINLGIKTYTNDFHCVTTWSKKDVIWTGIPFEKITSLINPNPKWTHLIQHGADGYSTNVPREDLENKGVFLAFELDHKPIPKEHGYIRLIIPHLYAWKTSKFLIKLEFTNRDKPGFWETRGYHNRGDAFKEERYS